MAQFRLLSTTGDQTIEITAGRTIQVGRAATSDAPVFDATVSRKHAELTLTDGGVQIRDLGSANGTFVNGTRISQHLAQNGDIVTFGKVAFKVLEIAPPSEKPSAPPAPAEPEAAKPVPEPTIVRQVAFKDPQLDIQERARQSGAVPVTADGAVADKQAEKLSLLLEISKELSKQQDVDRLLEKVVDITFQVMNVDRVSIHLMEGRDQELVPRVSKNRLGGVGGSRHVPTAIAQRAVQERLAILTDNAAVDQRFGDRKGTIIQQNVQSAMCAPLLGSDANVLGLVYVDNLSATHAFGDEDLEFLIAFSGIAAVAIENTRLTERVQREAVVLSNFQRYFAPDLAAQILEHEEAVQLGGQKRPVVVFFSDIRGFTSMSENMNPDEIATLLTEYFTEMVEIVFEHGGTLDKFMGDAIMALWGAPIAHDDDADRAMAAAIEQQRTLEKLNEKWAREGRQQVQIGIGINFGEVFAGNIGSDRRLEYTVIGDAVNVASRLCSKAAASEIMISEPFYRALKNPPEVEQLDPIELKGKAEAVPVYRVKL
ncbi:MAG: adenylate/guanylate cyclase domain-containing protein [Gemmatimonadales bacterium]